MTTPSARPVIAAQTSGEMVSWLYYPDPSCPESISSATMGRFRTSPETATTDREPISGLVERVTFHNPDTGFCVLRLNVRGHRDLVSLIGSAASVAPGEYVTASGRWETNRDHGLQFRATLLQSALPSTVEG